MDIPSVYFIQPFILEVYNFDKSFTLLDSVDPKRPLTSPKTGKVVVLNEDPHFGVCNDCLHCYMCELNRTLTSAEMVVSLSKVENHTKYEIHPIFPLKLIMFSKVFIFCPLLTSCDL